MAARTALAWLDAQDNMDAPMKILAAHLNRHGNQGFDILKNG